jgi:hypothetical protein
MVAAEPFLIVQAHRSEGGGYGSLAWGEDRTCEQQLNMLPDATGEQWREGARTRIIVVGRVRIDYLFWRSAVTSVPYPFTSKWPKSSLERMGYSDI